MKSFYHSNESFTSQSRPKYGSFTSRLREISSHLTLLILFLTVFSGNVWADMMIEGFETKTASSSYKNTYTVTTAESDCGISWEIYYGNVSTTNKIDGSNSVAMKLYSGEDNYSYLKSTTTISNLNRISFSATAQTADKGSASIQMDVQYSTDDGANWSYMKMSSATGDNYTAQTPTNSGNGAGYTAFVPSDVTGDFLVKFSINSSSSKPSSGNIQLTIDNVTFFTDESGQKFELVDDDSKLSSGDDIIILNAAGNKALGTTGTTNRSASTDFSLSTGVVTLSDNTVQVIKLLSESTYWALFAGEGYLYASSSSSNNMSTQCANTTNGEFSISISEEIASITAQGDKTHNKLKNYSSVFSCYESGNNDVKIYKRQATRYDYFKDIMHDNVVANQSGSYSISDQSADATLVGSHYKFVGWVAEDEIKADGTLESGYTLIAPGTAMTANGTTYYAIWATDL